MKEKQRQKEQWEKEREKERKKKEKAKIKGEHKEEEKENKKIYHNIWKPGRIGKVNNKWYIRYYNLWWYVRNG